MCIANSTHACQRLKMVPEQQKQKVPIAKAHAPYSQSPCSVTDAVDIQLPTVTAMQSEFHGISAKQQVCNCLQLNTVDPSLPP